MIEIIEGEGSKDKNPGNLRIIRTARSEQAINQAATEGFRPLVKRVEKSREIYSKFAVYQNKVTGHIQVIGDFRGTSYLVGGEELVEVIPFSRYYPHCFESPYAAYLVPSDIEVGERVILEDLIEDIVGDRWNQGDTYRLSSCEAIWNGKAFEVQVPPNDGSPTFIG